MADQPQPPEQPKDIPKDIYELAPDEPPPTPPQRPKIDAPGMLADFDEDADFDRDPELERAITGKPAPGAPGAAALEPAPPLPEFVHPGLGPPKAWAIAGGVLLLAAMVATAATSHARFLAPILTLYSVLVHTGTGLVAVFVAAYLCEHRVGRIDLAAARMLTAVAAFSLIFHINIPLIGGTKTEETILGAIAYLAIISGTFRIWRERLLYVAGTHFILWMLVQVGMALSAAVAKAQPLPPTP